MSKKLPIIYRQANKSDLGTISTEVIDLFDSHAKYGWYFSFKTNYKRIISEFIKKVLRSKDSAIFVAEHNGKIIGHISIFLAPQPRENMQVYVWKKEAQIEDLFVDLKYRKHGVGKHLFNLAIKFAQKKKADVVSLVADRKNTHSKKFFNDQGMDLYDETYVLRLVKNKGGRYA